MQFVTPTTPLSLGWRLHRKDDSVHQMATLLGI
jgi:hypothetical protein